jgi:hypothetical protein
MFWPIFVPLLVIVLLLGRSQDDRSSAGKQKKAKQTLMISLLGAGSLSLFPSP